MRVLEWIVGRARTHAPGMETQLGRVPVYENLNWEGLEDFSKEDFERVMSIDQDLWKQEILSHEELFIKLYDRLPKELLSVRELLLSSLWSRPEWGNRQE